jgi:hypothetical protein
VSEAVKEESRDEVRVKILKNTFVRIVKKREEKVITNLVNEYRSGTLDANKAYAAIMVIAELRNAGSGIGATDLI